MIRLLKILQNFKDIFKKKNYFFQKFWGCPGPPWSSSGSATYHNMQIYISVHCLFDKIYQVQRMPASISNEQKMH